MLQSFEHAQSTSLSNRGTHSGNQCTGVRIAEDIIMAWLQSSPDVHYSLYELEEVRVSGRSRRKYNL